MAQPYFVPQSLANIYQRAADEQAQYIDQPKGLAAALPQLGQTFLQATDIYKQQQQKRSLQQAQQMYSNYLAKVDNGSATPEDHAAGRMAALSLGISPQENLNPKIWSALQSTAGIDANVPGNKQNVQGVETLARLKDAQSRMGSTQLTADEYMAIKSATQRKISPLSLDWLKARGPGAKILAQSLMDDPSYDPTIAGAQTKAREAGAVSGAQLSSGGSAQQSARAANTVILLTDGLLKASNNFSRANSRFLNTPINAIDEQSGTAAMTFKQYLVDTRSKMATALQGGGVPQQEAQETIAKNFPDTMTAAQIPVAIQNIKDIMNTQIKGALTGVSGPVQRQSPTPGDVIKGYRFKGGDPSNQSSWEKM